MACCFVLFQIHWDGGMGIYFVFYLQNLLPHCPLPTQLCLAHLLLRVGCHEAFSDPSSSLLAFTL